MRVKYLRQLFRGVLFAEDSVRPLDVSRPTLDQIDPRCVAFSTFEREERTENGVELKSGELNQSPLTYFGTIRTLADVERDEPKSILAANMRGNGYARVVDVGGNTWPIDDDATVLPVRP